MNTLPRDLMECIARDVSTFARRMDRLNAALYYLRFDEALVCEMLFARNESDPAGCIQVSVCDAGEGPVSAKPKWTVKTKRALRFFCDTAVERVCDYALLCWTCDRTYPLQIDVVPQGEGVVSMDALVRQHFREASFVKLLPNETDIDDDNFAHAKQASKRRQLVTEIVWTLLGESNK
jgi:hypothetical protein